MSFCESFSVGEIFESKRSLLVSKGSLKVVRFRVFGGVGLGCRGSDEAKVAVVVTVFVGDEFAIGKYKKFVMSQCRHD